MIVLATLLLSETGARVLGSGVFPQAKPENPWIIGMMISYDEQGVWFQDERLLGQNRIVLVKWNFIDAILSETPSPETISGREIGFR